MTAMKYAALEGRPGWETGPRDRPEPVFYVWRDPRRVSPGRLAELAEHDEHIRRLERDYVPEPEPEPRGEARGRKDGTGWPASAQQAAQRKIAARMAARKALFVLAREAGKCVDESARIAGVSDRTGTRWEAERKAS
jgi:hypothetical protein